MSLACLVSDWTLFSRKKSYLFWVDRSATLASASYLATLLWRKGDEDYFSPKLRVRIKDNNNSPHGKFHRFLFPFSSKFSDLNFASYVLYIYPCYVTWHTQWAWVTYDRFREGTVPFSDSPRKIRIDTVFHEEYKSRNRHNVECFFWRCTIFGLAKPAFFRCNGKFTMARVFM